MKQCEQIESDWKPVNDGPDDETSVLVGFDDGAVCEGYCVAGVWRGSEGIPFNEAPVCWLHMPKVPEGFLAAEHRVAVQEEEGQSPIAESETGGTRL